MVAAAVELHLPQQDNEVAHVVEVDGMHRLKCHKCGVIVAQNLPDPMVDPQPKAEAIKSHAKKCGAKSYQFSISIQQRSRLD